MTTIDIPSRTHVSLSAFAFTAITMDGPASGVVGSFSTSPSHRLPSEDMRSNMPNTKRLRSCLSPTRNRRSDEASAPSSEASSPMASRSTSFSSADSSASAWRRKQVRWQSEEMGCDVASYHATWSASEYDRTPLDPPSEGERACVMPARNSRCLSPLEMFSDSGRSRSVSHDRDEDEDEYDCAEEDDSPRSLESIILATPPSESEDGSDDGCPDGAEEDEEDRQWAECMERRTMMFAQMAAQRNMQRTAGESSLCGGLDGYTSLSATLAELLKSVGCQNGRGMGGPSTPQTVDGEESDADDRDSEAERTPVLPKRPIGPSGLRSEYTASLAFGRSRRLGEEDDSEDEDDLADERRPVRCSSPLETPELDDTGASSPVDSALTSPLELFPTSALHISIVST